MQFNLTTQDIMILKVLSSDLYNVLKKKKGEGPEYGPAVENNFYELAEGEQADELIKWAEDFKKRLTDADTENR